MGNCTTCGEGPFKPCPYASQVISSLVHFRHPGWCPLITVITEIRARNEQFWCYIDYLLQSPKLNNFGCFLKQMCNFAYM